MNKATRFNLAYLLIAAFGVLILRDMGVRTQPVAPIAYSEFQRLVREKKVSKVAVSENEIRGELTEPIDGKPRFVTTRVDPKIAEELDKYGVEYAGQLEDTTIP